MNIIGLSGYAQTGKDTAADILIQECGYERVAFADILREAIYRLDPALPRGKGKQTTYAAFLDSCGGYEAARKTKQKDEIRRLLQRFGTDVGRKMFGENFWVDQTMSRLDPYTKYVITDCRFPNEAQAVEKAGGVMWRISRLGVGPANQHPSETSLDDWHFPIRINNNSTLEDFRATVLRTEPYRL